MVIRALFFVMVLLGWRVTVASLDTGKLLSADMRRGPAQLFKKIVASGEDSWGVNIADELSFFLYSASPEHLFYVLHDDTFSDMDGLLRAYAERKIDVLVIKFTPDLAPLYDILTHPVTFDRSVRRHVIMLCSMQNVVQVFKMVALRNLESPALWWMVVMVADESDIEYLPSILREGSQVILMKKEADESYSSFFLNFNTAGKPRFSKVGRWSRNTTRSNEHLRQAMPLHLDEIYSDFAGRQLLIVTKYHFPYIVLEENVDGEPKLVSGIDGSIIMALSKALNFTYKIMLPPDGAWGGPLPNGSVTGMVGVVARREAHFSACEITIIRSRETVIDYTTPYHLESLLLISRSPKEKNRAFAAFSPFTYTAWSCIGAAVIVMGLLVFIEESISSRYLEKKSKSHGMSSAFFNMFRSTMRQENLLSSLRWSSRALFIFWYFFCYIIAALYSGMLTATLVIPTFEEAIDSLTDIPKAVEEGFTFAVSKDTTLEYLFRDAKEGIYADSWKLFNHKDKSKSFLTDIEGTYDKILSEKLVFVFTKLTSKLQATKRGINRYHFSRETFSFQHYGIVCLPGAPFIGRFNRMLHYMTDGGLVTKWINDEYRRASSSSSVKVSSVEVESKSKAFNIRHLQGAFYILSIGFVVATISLCFELVLKRSEHHVHH